MNESDFGAGGFRVADDGHRHGGLAARELHLVDLPALAHFNLEVFRDRVYALRADPVQAARNLVRALAEFAAGVEVRHHELERGDFVFGVDVDGNAAPVVLDGA